MKTVVKFSKNLIYRFFTLLMLLMLCFSQHSFAAPTTPSSDFIDNADGTVTHKTTGLVWQRCSVGQLWDSVNSNCTGTANLYNYTQALALKSDFAGKTDWRLPTVAELETLVERNNYTPAINSAIFPATPTSNYFWSASSYAAYDVMGWMLSFDNGKIYMSNKNIQSAVRLVRAGQPIAAGQLFTPNTDFTDNGDGTVTHKRTGFTWMRCAMGQTWSAATSTCTGTYATYSYDQATKLTSTFAGQSDWRLPNANELLTIAEYGAYPAINGSIFSNPPIKWFWTSTVDASFTSNAWIVYFDSGEITAYGRGDYHAVRLMRSGPPAKPASAVYNVITQSAASLDFGTSYDGKNSKIIELKNTSFKGVKVSDVVVSDAGSYWVNLFVDNKKLCRPVFYTQTVKTFIIPARSSCRIEVGFSPFANVTAGKALPATITLKTLINAVATDKVINVTGIGRAQSPNAYNNLKSYWGQNTWAMAELKAANPPINAKLVGASLTYSMAKFWYGAVLDAALQQSTASVGNLVVFAQNNFNIAGHVGVVIQTSPVVTMLSMNDVADANGVKVRKWSVRPIDYFGKAATWQPLITGLNASDATKHYGFIDWNSSLY